MPNKGQGTYKTEDQLKQEAKERRTAEAAASAARPESELHKKRENFWYHYKWHTIVGVAVVVLAVFFIKDMFFGPHYDATIIMVSERYFSAEDIDGITAAIGEATSTPESAGAPVLIDYITLPSDDGQGAAGSQDYANNMKLVTVTAAGIDPIYLLDEAAYRHLVKMGRTEDGPPDTDNVFVEESISAELLGRECEGLRFYLRRHPGKDEDYYERCRELLQRIAGES